MNVCCIDERVKQLWKSISRRSKVCFADVLVLGLRFVKTLHLIRAECLKKIQPSFFCSVAFAFCGSLKGVFTVVFASEWNTLEIAGIGWSVASGVREVLQQTADENTILRECAVVVKPK